MTSEEKLFTDVQRHYQMSEEDLSIRRPIMDKADELFRSHIDEKTWPYSSLIFIPLTFTNLFEKTSRLIGSKPRGRLVPREGGDVLGAKVNNEVLSYQWDDAVRVDGEPLIAKWALMDQNTRKYGAAFSIVPWHYERKLMKEAQDQGAPQFISKPWYDGPYMKVLANRDVLANPSYSTVKNWFGERKYVTLVELLAINDVARGAPIYKNLDKLRRRLKDKSPDAGASTQDTRDSNYMSRNKSIQSMQDFLGRDETNRTIEIVNEYRDNRWITYAPKYGLILRDIENPYKHQSIPVVMLKYYPVDDDLYGIPEWESIEKMQKAMNAISSQYVDAVNMELYPIFGVDSTRVRMHTMSFEPRSKWIISGNPDTAVKRMDFSAPNSIGQFKTVYGMLKSEIQEAMGDTSATTSQVNPYSADKTATEIKDSAASRLARDNFNQVFLSEAIKKQMMFWYSMNQQFLFEKGEKYKIIQIVGKDAIAYFQEQGLDQMSLGEDAANTIADSEALGNPVNPQDFQTPQFPVDMGEGAIVPKMNTTPDGQFAELYVTPDDLIGNYNYIADIESMAPPNDQQVIGSMKAAIDIALNPSAGQLLAQEGKQVKFSEMLEAFLEKMGFKDASKYFTSLQQANGQIDPATGQPIAGGAPAAPGIPQGQGMGPTGAVPNIQAPPGGPNPPLMG